MFFRRAKNKQWSFAFEGRIADAVLQEHGLTASSATALLLEKQSEIEDEIQTAVAKTLRAEVTIALEFDETTCEWYGEIDAQCESRFGTAGLMGLRQLVGSAISRVLGKHLPAGLSRPHTRVVITASPWADRQSAETGAGGMSKAMFLLVLSTIPLYLVAIAVLGLIALSLLGVISVPSDNSTPADTSYQSFRINYL